MLFDLARRIHDLELTICHAKISTYVDQVVDVFYVSDRSGAKLQDEAQIERLRLALVEVIEAES